MIRHRRRGGFATFEMFVVATVFLIVGLGVTFLLRWLTGTSHWATWTPAVIFGIPCLIAYGVIAPMIVYSVLRHKLTGRD